MNLKKLRQEASLTQQDVAKDCGLTLRSYQNYESQLREMNYETLRKLADYFGCSIDYLLGHQTTKIAQLELLTSAQRELFDVLKTLDDKEAYSVIGYINHMRGTPLNDLVEKILNEGRK